MNSKEIINTLNEYDVFEVLVDLGADPILNAGADHIEARTICHNGSGDGSHKLYYYFDTKAWVCYTGHCKIGNIINLIMMTKNWEFYEAIRYLCDKFNLKNDEETEELLDLSFFKKFDKKEKKYEYNFIDDHVLNIYYPYYHRSWLSDNITVESMRKYNILFNVKEYRIVIPHYDLEGNLIGIRRRNLLEHEIERGKYLPEYQGKEVYSHSLGNNIYGLNFVTKERINKSSNTLVLFEAEKSVLQLEGYDLGVIGGALCGSNLTEGQFHIIVELLNKWNIDEVIIALDKEFEQEGDELSEFYKRRIRENIINKLLPYVDVSVLWDTEGLLDYKDSPSDKGKEVFVKMLNSRIRVYE